MFQLKEQNIESSTRARILEMQGATLSFGTFGLKAPKGQLTSNKMRLQEEPTRHVKEC